MESVGNVVVIHIKRRNAERLLFLNWNLMERAATKRESNVRK